MFLSREKVLKIPKPTVCNTFWGAREALDNSRGCCIVFVLVNKWQLGGVHNWRKQGMEI